MLMPSCARTGTPFSTMARSVVVPPMSATMASVQPVSAMPPETLHAGPQRMVSTGCAAVKFWFITLPSERTITTGAVMLRSCIAWRIAARNCPITGSRRALSRVLAARFMQ